MNHKKLNYNIVILLILALCFSIGIFSPISNKYREKIALPKSSDGEITIMTPENKTYTQADSGYYPATYGFENDIEGSIPKEWVFSYDLGPDGGTTTVMKESFSHENVLEINDLSSSKNIGCKQYFAENKTHGTIDFWIYIVDATWFHYFDIYSSNGIERYAFAIREDKWYYYEPPISPQYGIGWIDISDYLPIPVDNTWIRVKVEFEHSTSEYNGLSQHEGKITVNGQSYNRSIENFEKVGSIRFSSLSTDVSIFYVDAVGYSWDPNYNIGDNLDEGLLLSYDNSTNLDWQGYSLDNQANHTILGNKTIPMPADGSHNIQVFGNDTMGTMYESDIRYFTVNTAPPEITINSPTHSQIVGSTSPSYDLSITGPYDSIWYSLDGGSTNITASGLTGTINQATWTALADGIITIDFYANNSAGMEGNAQVQVFKQVSIEPPPGIPGYDLYLLIGALSVISALIIRKRVKY